MGQTAANAMNADVKMIQQMEHDLRRMIEDYFDTGLDADSIHCALTNVSSWEDLQRREKERNEQEG